MIPDVELAPGAEDNGLACMLAGLIRQNMQAKPHKQVDFAGLDGTVAIVAEDVDVALTLRFESGSRLTIYDGIVGIPDVTVRGPSDVIIALSNMPMATPFGLPIPHPRDKESVSALRAVIGALGHGTLHVYGAVFHLSLVLKLGRLMSVNG
ncbi:MAG: hypothetical protein ABSF69_12850 [Polyangiaceae bacterium]|jgi:hypothetical protein